MQYQRRASEMEIFSHNDRLLPKGFPTGQTAISLLRGKALLEHAR